MNKFEQLIEYVINDDEAKARELFHDIVVEKSRSIYESMMEADEEIEEGVECDDEEEEIEEGMMGGDQSDDLIDDIEVEEEGFAEGEEEFEIGGEEELGGDFGDEEGGEDLEDRVVDLEDKLDELMAEFETLMGTEEAEHGEDLDADGDVEGDEMSDEEVADDELETEGMFEAVSLKAVPKPTHGDDGANAKSPVAANSGAKGMAANPVKMTGDTAQGRPAPQAKELIGKVGNSPAQSTQKPTPAPKPHLAQATGVNNKSVTN